MPLVNQLESPARLAQLLERVTERHGNSGEPGIGTEPL